MCLKFDERATYFLLDVDPEKLKAAPGFHRDNWPDTTDPNWAQEIDAYYRGEQAQREAVPHETPSPAPKQKDESQQRWVEEDLAATVSPVSPETEHASDEAKRREQAVSSVR
jgi:hypothetical protein